MSVRGTGPDAAGSHVAEVLAATPEFTCGDEHLSWVYRHRWESFARHVVRSPRGWVVTEFRQPGPGRAYGTVNAAAGHHILEGRWLRRTDVIEDYIRFWYTTADAEPNRYTEWIGWATREFARLHDSWDVAADVLPGMVRVFDAWDEVALHPSGLYWAHDLADAMEFSISGDGMRPSINSYQYGNADAIADVAERAGNDETAGRFRAVRDRLRRVVIDRLYDDRRQFFTTLPMSPSGDGAYLATAGVDRTMPAAYRDRPLPARTDVPVERDVRELVGFIPWYVDLPGDEVDPAPSVAQLSDPDGFAAPFGLRTAERRHPRYGYAVPDAPLPRFLCRWNGPTWPFATSQALTALARIARASGDDGSRGVAFLAALRQYANSHLGADGAYLLDEFLDPDTGEWIARDWRRRNDPDRVAIGTDYNHSTFADLILSGLLGLDVRDDSIVVEPLACATDLGWFEARGLFMAGVDVAVTWSPEAGLSLTAGAASARWPDLGILRIPIRAARGWPAEAGEGARSGQT